ncbi:MAG: hypothetical protein ACTTJ7_05725, partial [Treponema sp.]
LDCLPLSTPDTISLHIPLHGLFFSFITVYAMFIKSARWFLFLTIIIYQLPCAMSTNNVLA